MSLHYLLDGYNIIHQMPTLIQLELDQQRLSLVRHIEQYNPQGSSRNSITIYFDGRPGRAQPIVSTSVKIIFTQDRSADDRIKQAVKSSANSRRLVVVTDDRDIQYSICAHGARVVTVAEFLGRLTRKNAGTAAEGPVKKIDPSAQEEINDELKSLWLKKKRPK